METVILAALVAALLLFWVNKRRPGIFAGTPPARTPGAPRMMPRLGEPGTMTEAQAEALRRNRFTPHPSWSSDEAALILDALLYLRTVCEETLGEREPDVGIQNELLAFILTDEDLRNHIRKWGADRRAAGIEEDPPQLRRNHQFERVAGKARELAG